MGLPSGYRQLTYVQSNAGQYIDTGFKPTNNTKVDIVFQTQSSSGVITGADAGWLSNGFAIAVTAIEFYNARITPSFADGAKYNVVLDKGVVTVDGTSKGTIATGTFTSAYSMFLFGNNRSGSLSEATNTIIYSCKIYDNNTLVRDFIPCYNPSNVAGLYDLVNGQFYSSATSTALLGGAYMSIKTGDILNYDYTGAVQTVTLPKGVYKLECWGASGGYRSGSTYAGYGGYSVGTLTLTEPTNIFIYSGGSGQTGGTSGGFNGGGKRSSYNGGGGASDIRIGQDSLYARVIVAGGGGSCGSSTKHGMYGGGETGGSSSESYGSGGYGGTQTGVSSSSWQTTTQPTSTSSQAGAYAGFGFGGNGIYRSSGYGGAGGGGWYGGSGAYPDGSGDDDRGGGGGSGYVYTSTTATNYPSGCLLTSAHYLTDAQTIAGNASMPSTSGSTETGHQGNGYVRITAVKVQSLNMPVNIGGSWKDSEAVYVNIGGTWKEVEAAYVIVGGVWKELG